ncbi:MAG: hypothetical protein ACTSWY_13845 [Promethearchaeota archaeon]
MNSLKFENYRNVLKTLKYILDNHKDSLINQKISIDLRKLAGDLGLEGEISEEIWFLFNIFFRVFKHFFLNPVKQKEVKKIKEIREIKEIIENKRRLHFDKLLRFIYYVSCNRIIEKDNKIRIPDNSDKLAKKMNISREELYWIFKVFVSFHRFYGIFFSDFKEKSPEIDIEIEIDKQNADSLTDFSNLFGKKVIDYKKFKQHFPKLFELCKNSPSLFQVSSSEVRISDKGKKLSDKVLKYRKIGRSPPQEFEIGGGSRIKIIAERG